MIIRVDDHAFVPTSWDAFSDLTAEPLIRIEQGRDYVEVEFATLTAIEEDNVRARILYGLSLETTGRRLDGAIQWLRDRSAEAQMTEAEWDTLTDMQKDNRIKLLMGYMRTFFSHFADLLVLDRRGS